ncbi:membrane or secreted protein [Hymenobacter sp. HMF4947]|uniref:Membrane or secreted protein n=1 Tax=Hymenobacter ginkgonis TaxID=2682976 RepID=A0A7K1TK73_9BACT|nr:membrane or secreted protein [Hymenobacter ginkgonis]MVN78736.1 membrane or secreted protein [Hymenobacter ginkgonis]
MPRFLLLFISGLLALSAGAQAPTPPPQGDVFVDAKGVLRWQKTKREVALFGVNYTAPFAYSYRATAAVGTSHEQGIDQDVYHLSRMGVDAFRLHVWDIEITDTLGNLQQNEHLRLLDYLISKLKARGIKIILTPIAYWGNAYPEPKNTGPGFSSIYDKGVAYTNPRAIKAQENYLGQFLNHRNQYTGLLNRQDPDIIAFEVCNEPHYHLPLAPVKEFANRLVAAMRATAYQKPIFYNIAESPTVHDAILDANVQGLTFQWYPEGLVARHELKGNFLPYVDQYPLPYKGDARFERRAKMVYEFESADVLQPIMYPFVAKSLREAGFQWATQFAYDPLAIAAYNTEYQTHYLNLAYTPAKAVSTLIASKVFHEVKRGQSFGRYPADSVFGAALVSYRRQLSQWNAPTEFYYSANTIDKPVKPAALRHVGGVGSSGVVQYGGSGAYFLDQLAPGVWRLEVMPDAVLIRDPFETPSLKKPVTQISWADQPLTIALADLGPSFALKGLNDGNTAQAQASGGRLTVRPGAYLLTRAGQNSAAYTAQSPMGAIRLGEFVAPPATALPAHVRHQPVAQASAGQPLVISATVAGVGPADSVLLVARHYYGPTRTLPMQRTGTTTVAATVPTALTYPGLLRYWVVVKKAGQPARTFPGSQAGSPADWDYYDAAHWEVPLVPTTAPLPLFVAATDRGSVEAQGISQGAYIDYPTTAAGAPALRLVVAPPKANPAAPAAPATGPAASLRTYLGLKTAGRAADLASFKELVIKGQTNQVAATQLRVVLVTRDAVAYAATVPLTANVSEVHVPLSALQPAPLLLSPRPYPGFLPLTYSPTNRPALRLADVEVLQVVLDAPTSLTEQLRVDVESVTLQ